MLQLLKEVFRKKPKMVVARKDAKEYRIGGSWGDAINWFEREQFDGKHLFFRIMGWKTPKPQVGDYLTDKMKSGKVGRFVFQTIEPCEDPPDMFFGDVAFLDYKP